MSDKINKRVQGVIIFLVKGASVRKKKYKM